MLFSDVEGSTALLSRLGDRWGEALSAHRAILRGLFREFGGHEMGTEGDGFFVVFGSAADAVCCCVVAQRNLAGHHWPGGVSLRVRMGLHSGEPARHEDGYVGLDVHRAARIAAAAHGRQVVASDATRLLAAAHLPAGVCFRDLGFHRLKDIEAPERLFQLTAVGLPDRFPPLRSLGTWTSFPQPVTPLVGRDGELESLRATVARPEVRLVTLTGPGGVGKTRLALATAALLHEAFPHGGYFVPLAAVRDGEMMWKAIAGTLDMSGDGPGADAVTGYLRERRALLVLDNLEQLDGAAAVAAALLTAAPGVVIVARRCCSPIRRRWSGPGSRSPRATPPTSRRFAPGWTGCRWRLSWPPPGSSCSHRRRCWPGSGGGWPWPRPMRADRSASRRCATRSRGAMSCSAPHWRGCSGG
jgi:class 3 adenylate cyclase